MWKVVNSTRIKTAEEGFNKVHEQGQKFAFLWDVAIIEYKILTDQDCSLTTVKVRIIYSMIILNHMWAKMMLVTKLRCYQHQWCWWSNLTEFNSKICNSKIYDVCLWEKLYVNRVILELNIWKGLWNCSSTRSSN